jgi:hypothetical protein
MKKDYYKITLTGLTGNTIDGNLGSSGNTTFQLPIYLEEKFDNLGVMVDFDGNVEQMEQFCNFTYSGYNQTIYIYNTINSERLKTIVDSKYTIDWGDGNTGTTNMPSISEISLPNSSHIYGDSITGTTITITVKSAWGTDTVRRFITLPYKPNYGWYPSGDTKHTQFGELCFKVPYSNTGTTTGITQTQQYLFNYRDTTGKTEPANISFMAVGKSRLNEFKKYGNGGGYSIVLSYETTELGNYTGYTIDGLTYFDYSGGYTHITGTTSGTTDFPYVNEQVYKGMLTRNEILIGFIDEPQIYSDIFVERGKQSIIERNLRLGEIDNMGELEIYGGGYFKVKKQ